MSYPLDQQFRDACADSMQHNLDSMHKLRPDTTSTIREMIAVARMPYSTSNIDTEGDTLDRHSWSPYGNALEVVDVAMWYHVGNDVDTIVCRSLPNQHQRKIDIGTTHGTVQVKRARIGTYGDVFISRDEIKGEAVWIDFIDGANRKLYRLSRETFRSYVREREWAAIEPWKLASVDRTTDTIGWHLKPAWAIECGWLTVVDIPNHIQVPYYDHRTKTVEVK
jgi:hypothetical protein